VIGLVANVMRESKELDTVHVTEFVNKTQRAVDRMLQLISDLLDFDKMEKGTFFLEPYTETIQKIIHPVIDVLKPLADAKQQTIESYVEPDVPEVAADSRHAGRVVSNLLSNSIARAAESLSRLDSEIIRFSSSFQTKDRAFHQNTCRKFSSATGRQRQRNARGWA
jgi:signal transduction histidine kinase